MQRRKCPQKSHKKDTPWEKLGDIGIRLGLYCFQRNFPCNLPHHDGHLFSIHVLPSSPPTPHHPLVWKLFPCCSVIEVKQDARLKWLVAQVQMAKNAFCITWVLMSFQRTPPPRGSPSQNCKKLSLCLRKSAFGKIKMQAFWESCKMFFPYTTQPRKVFLVTCFKCILSMFRVPSAYIGNASYF